MVEHGVALGVGPVGIGARREEDGRDRDVGDERGRRPRLVVVRRAIDDRAVIDEDLRGDRVVRVCGPAERRAAGRQVVGLRGIGAQDRAQPVVLAVRCRGADVDGGARAHQEVGEVVLAHLERVVERGSAGGIARVDVGAPCDQDARHLDPILRDAQVEEPHPALVDRALARAGRRVDIVGRVDQRRVAIEDRGRGRDVTRAHRRAQRRAVVVHGVDERLERAPAREAVAPRDRELGVGELRARSLGAQRGERVLRGLLEPREARGVGERGFRAAIAAVPGRHGAPLPSSPVSACRAGRSETAMCDAGGFDP